MQYLFGSAVIILAALAQTPALGKGIVIDSREYKMMLDKDHFAGSAPEQAIDGFVRDQLVPAVRQSFGDDAAVELRKKGLDPKERRLVRFWDTQACGLSGHGFALRERVDLDAHDRPGDEHELTLKFRSPDLFMAAAMGLADHAGDDDSKFEEDMGALAIRNAEVTTVAFPASSRSQFSRSFGRTVAADALPRDLGDVERLYPGFADDLLLVAGTVDMAATLASGPSYRELVYESSKLAVAGGTKAEVALTIWYRAADAAPALAEISFKYHTDEGVVTGETARRARDLLLALEALPWADPAAPTKTAQADCVD
jgi:hypothetical protein